MFKSHLHKLKKFYWLLLLPFVAGVFITSCGDTPVSSETSTSVTDSSDVNTNIDFTPDNFNAVGKIQGTVIDKATGEALSDVAVTLQFFPDAADEPSVITDSTGSGGRFAYSGVPVNTNANYSNNNSPYTLEINTGELDNYRDTYRMNVVLTFEPTGGDGSATNLVSDVTVPLSEQSVTVNGKLQTSNGKMLSDVRVELHQNFVPVINDASSTVAQLVDSATTATDGSFTFEGVEENTNIWVEAVDESDPSEVIRYTSSIWSTESASGDASSTLNLGVVEVQQGDIEDEAGSLYVTSVTPEPGSDIGSTDTSFVYVFNRSIAENPYTNADLGFNSGTFKDDIEFEDDGAKKSPGDVEFDVSWSSNRDSLTITPEGLTDATRYTLHVTDAFDDPKFVDEYDNQVSWGASEYDASEIESLNFSTGVNTDAPHTPELTLQEGDSVNYNGGELDYSWEVDESAVDVKEYEVWRQYGDMPYERVDVISSSASSFGEITDDFAPSVGTPLVSASGDIPGGGDTPDGAVTHSYKVRAISTNLTEGEFSNEVTFADSTGPNIASATLQGNVVQISLDEPMIKSQLENTSNYSFTDGSGTDITGDITITDIMYSASYDFSYWVGFSIEDETNLSEGYTVSIDGATDLAGNELNTAEATLEDLEMHTPTLAVSSTSPTVEPNVDYKSGDVELSWEVMENPPAEVDAYQLYVKEGDGDYNQVGGNIDKSQAEFGEFTWNVSPNGGNPLVAPDGNGDNPDTALPHEYKVRAIQINGGFVTTGEFSNTITVADTVKPTVTNVTYNGTTQATVTFAEPMQKSLAEDAGHYTFYDNNGTPGDASDDTEIDVTIETIEYDGSYSQFGAGTYQATIYLETGDNVDGAVGEYIEVSSDVTDLAGNGLDEDNNSDTY